MWARALVCAALATTSVAACSKVTYQNPGTMPSGQVTTEKGWFFVFGLVGEKEIWANKICPTGVSRIQSKFSFLDIIVTGITFNLITPRSYEIECGR
jgi:hypothetical protein